MRKEAFRAWLAGRINGNSVGSYVSNAHRVERVLGRDLDLCDLGELGLSNIRSDLLRAGIPPRTVSDCLSALRQYRELAGPAHPIAAMGSPLRHLGDSAVRVSSPEERLPPLSGPAILSEATQELGIDLVALVARCAIWADPSIVEALMRVDKAAAWVPNCRRLRPGERRGTFVDSVRLDDNSQANNAIKLATFGHRNLKGFHACHVWEGSCYDPRHHTSIPNLILLPAPLASLTDYDEAVSAALRYRAYELYGWRPEDEKAPERPARYPGPEIWRAFPPITDQVKARLARRLAAMPDA